MTQDPVRYPRVASQVSRLIPAHGRQLLMQAALEDSHIPIGESAERTRALAAATDRCRELYPHLFR